MFATAISSPAVTAPPLNVSVPAEGSVVMITETQISSILRRSDFSRASCSVMPGNIFGRKTLRATCCVMVLAPAV